MKLFVVLASVLTVSLCQDFLITKLLNVNVFSYLDLVPEEQLLEMDLGPNMTHFLVEESDGVYATEDLVNSEVIQLASSSDVTYYFYNQRQPDQGLPVKDDDLEPLTKYFRAAKDTFFIIHGWKNDYKSDVNVLIKRTILAHYDVNLFVVDWSPIASRNYVSAKWAVPSVGQFVGGFIKALSNKFGMQISSVSIAGHSLELTFLETQELLWAETWTTSLVWTPPFLCSLWGTPTSGWTQPMPNSFRLSTPAAVGLDLKPQLDILTTIPMVVLPKTDVVGMSSEPAHIPGLIFTLQSLWHP
ncbi:hypothetical protein NQ317_008580 [Molorchus minor]|uniref:Lipase domain-containing protein n=1 Tax=Molorchus minor TaxID=1323400 RepID=A0ABQ9J3D6_9CUCU|nr:hypothetical protein NQ317_008580 [Molorchus minor]